MKYYELFLKYGCFTYDDAVDLIGNESTALFTLNQYIKKGYIAKIRRGLYVAINLYDHEPCINKFVIASHISKSSYVSHDTAFEFYGYKNQVSYNVSVTSNSFFRPFTFNGYDYKHLNPTINKGIITTPDGVRVTDLERTILDCINNFQNTIGFEELINCLELVPFVNEAKLIEYLSLYNKCFLYQKTGYILEHYQKELNISNSFFKTCQDKANSSSRYLSNDKNTKDLLANQGEKQMKRILDGVENKEKE